MLKQALLLIKSVIAEYHVQAIYLSILTAVSGYISLNSLWGATLELLQSPTPLWVAIVLPVAAYLLLKTTISRSSVTPKKEKPNLSKKTEMQEQILNAFKTETNLDNIAKILNVEPTLVRRNVDILSKDLLIAWCGSGSPSWYLTEHGRAYLYPKP